MSRRLVTALLVALTVITVSVTGPPALAQGPAPSTSGGTSSTPTPALGAPRLAPAAPVTPIAPVAPAASLGSDKVDDRPARGPALRDRGARRPRAGGAASGALFLGVIVVIMGYYVIKKLRRHR